MMKTKPILFSTPMVQANSAGLKTQTRRIVDEHLYGFLEWAFKEKKNLAEWIFRNGKYRMGDILWVRETFGITKLAFVYKADFCSPNYDKPIKGWKPSIHMPKAAARQFLKVLNVRIERLQDISEEDAVSEGISPLGMSNGQLIKFGQLYLNYLEKPELLNEGLRPVESFKTLWEKIYGKKIPWVKNPFVFVYEYEITEKPEIF